MTQSIVQTIECDPPRIDVILSAEPPRTFSAPVQFVTPEGKLTQQGLEYGFDLELAQKLFRDMYLARSLDNAALALQRQGELGLWLMSLGQEAAQVGSIRALRDGDHVFPSYREHAAALARGISPHELLAQWRGTSHAGWNPDDYRFHMYSLVLGTQTLHATGYAMGVSLEQSEEIVMVYFGDGASSQGDVNEALNWAATVSAPVIFFCQNNQWAISTPSKTQSRTALYQRASGFGLSSYLVDGNDAMAVHGVTHIAAERVRNGQGPAFIEAETYRMAGHSTSDDPGKYRADSEVESWRRRDPISRLKMLLEASGTPDVFFSQLEDEGDALANETRSACRALEEPNLSELFKRVYAEPHRIMERQAEEYEAFKSSLENEAKA